MNVRWLKIWTLILALIVLPVVVSSQTAGRANVVAPTVSEKEASKPPHATVVVDGKPVIEVGWGISNFTVQVRADAISAKLLKIAEDESSPVELTIRQTEYGLDVMQGESVVAAVFDGDARAAAATREQVAELWRSAFTRSITEYRVEHSRGHILRRIALTTVVLFVTLGLLWILVPITRWFADRLSARVFRRASQSKGKRWMLIDTEQLNLLFRLIFRLLRWAISLSILYVAFQILFSIYPKTRPLGERMLEGVLSPARNFGDAAWRSLPSLVFIAIIALACLYLVKLVSYAFRRIGDGHVHIEGFRPQWAHVTARLVNLALILLAILIAYPYIPGSQSAAFKGFSLFLGVLVSLGSTGVVANILNGILLTYMDSFQKGDYVQIGTAQGYVEATSLFVTKIRTRQQTVVTVPNSQVLSGQIVNYSTAGENSLTLSTTAGIGYDTPWRQVEAMLHEAAQRTRSVRESPSPFVQEVSLNSFDITYELTVFLSGESAVGPIRAELNRNILDVFNQYGVQIMTPAYVADPPKPAVVAKDDWFASPARPDAADQIPPK